MTRYGMIMDVTKCNGCYNCVLACKDEHCGNDYTPYSVSQPMTGHFWMRMVEKERGKYPRVKVAYLAIPCMHCDNAPCIEKAKNRVGYQRPDGIVIIDPFKAKGQKGLISSCPYRVIYWNEDRQVPQKCTLCAHLLDQGYKEPRCVEACPTGALVFGDMDDRNSEIWHYLALGKTEPLHPEYRLGEKVRYIGLPKRFIAGALVFGDSNDCAGGVRVKLKLKGENKTQLVITDNFGNFEFEDLAYNKIFLVQIAISGYKSRTIKVKTSDDIYLGDIILNPK